MKLDLKIEGMTCNSCSNAITKRLSKFDFTNDIKIDHAAGTGELEVSEPVAEHKEQVIKAIEQIGYKVVN